MECSCNIDVGVDEFGTNLFSKIVTARKTHVCSECREQITIGQKYLIEKIIYGGNFNVYKTCLDCKAVRDIFFFDGYWYEMLWENLEDFIHESYGELPESCIIKLPDKAKWKVIDLVEKAYKYWEDEEDENL